ncbi:hypothetical protein DFQ04_0015 [Algoriphagus boseongensis]|uniref:META domain-containing protein n=1 Tax=Algoriphagus boseongensis TaxID=1442587 RepID=A0A4V3D2A9_9BACT|nr:hypothetical protein [Algoriphagus boseongensis]TDQ18217.1 hypothetical protein DFQ04_0015 [Algoriphagus boseongensis]
MKRILTLFILGLLFSCTEKEEIPRSDEFLINTLTTEQWRLEFYEENGVERVGLFEGINFIFLSIGKVEVYRGTQLLGEGAWKTRTANRRVEFELSFGENSNFKELNGAYYQTFLANERLMFREIGGNSGKQISLKQL